MSRALWGKQEMIEKIKKIQEKYQSENLLFTDRKETFYLCNADFDGFWLAVRKDEIFAVCSKMVENQVSEFFEKAALPVKVVAKTPLSDSVAEIFGEKGEKTLLTDANLVSAANFIVLQQKLAGKQVKLTAKTGILDSLRLVKTQKEIENIRISCKIISKICDTVKKELKPGISELGIHFRIMELLAQNKVKESFTPIVAAGANSANPHHASSNYKLRENDAVMIDLGCFYNGYASDLTRTFYLGKISGKFKTIWDIVKDSQSAVLKEIKAGLPLSWADKTARQVLEKAGYVDKFLHTTGHGLGIEIHEMPSLGANAEGFFLTNMAVTVEPGVYLNGEFGVRIEDTIIITEKGCEVLTSAEY